MRRQRVPFLGRVAVTCTYLAALILVYKQIAKGRSISLESTELSLPKRGHQEASFLKEKLGTKGTPIPLKKTLGDYTKGTTFQKTLKKKTQPPPIKRNAKQSSSRVEKKRSQFDNLKLEPLNKTNHFRSEIFLPYFLGSQVDFSKYTRRILLDLGATTFGSSVKWFLNNYPGRFTEIHAFEMKPGLFIPPPPKLDVLQGADLYYYEKRIDVVNTEKSVDIVDFILYEANFKLGDIVVVKMDIDGDEWKLLKHMEKGQVFHLIDEMMVNVHYNHPRMPRYGWQLFNHTLAEAYNLFKHLREDLGVFVHPWP